MENERFLGLTKKQFSESKKQLQEQMVGILENSLILFESFSRNSVIYFNNYEAVPLAISFVLSGESYFGLFSRLGQVVYILF